MLILNLFPKIIKEFFRFVFVSGVVYITTFLSIGQLAKWTHSKSDGHLFCSVTCLVTEELKRRYIEVGSFWLLVAFILFVPKKFNKAWGIDFFIISLVIMFILPILLR